MKNRKNVLLVFITFSFFSLSLFSQNKNFRFDNITASKGLPSNTINDIYQDKIGFLWFGTINGLVKYDGYNFKYVDKESEAGNLLSVEIISSITGDEAGNIWVSTQTGILFFVERSKEIVIIKDILDINASPVG